MYKLVAKDLFQYCRALATSGEDHRFGLAEILAKMSQYRLVLNLD